LVGGMLAILIAHLVRCRRSWNSPDARYRTANLGFAWISVCFLVFYGLDLYGQSLAHAPADVVIFSAFAWLSLRDPYRSVHASLWFGGLGAFAFAFDFLHGTIPLTLAMLLGCAALRAYAAGDRLGWRELIPVAGAFCLGVLGALAAKLAAVAAVEGSSGLGLFFGQLAYRVSGDDKTYLDVLGMVRHRISLICRWLRWPLHLFALLGRTVRRGGGNW
jgi:hypothetical protein